MTQIAHIVVGYARVVFGADGARYATFRKVFRGRPDTVTTVRSDPTVADQKRQWIHPTRRHIYSAMTGVFSYGKKIDI